MESETIEPNIGSVLRASRMARGISLDDVSTILKIRSDHLQALELDDFDRLPGSVYVIGFIRTYATYLELNGAELITRYKTLSGPLPLDEVNFDQTGGGEPISGAVKITIAVVAVFLLYLMWLIAGGASRQGNLPDNLVEAPDAPNAAIAPNAPNASVPSTETIVETPPVVAPPVVAPPQRPALEETPASEAPAATPPAATPPAATPPQQADRDTSETTSPEETALPEEIAAVEDPSEAVAEGSTETAEAVVEVAPVVVAQKIEIRASRRTWMRIENAEGRVLFSSIIRNGEGFELIGDAQFTLATRDAGALYYHVDGEEVGRVGRRGQILTARQIDRAMILALSN